MNTVCVMRLPGGDCWNCNVQVSAACTAIISSISSATPKADSVQSEDREGLVFLHCQVCFQCVSHRIAHLRLVLKN